MKERQRNFLLSLTACVLLPGMVAQAAIVYDNTTNLKTVRLWTGTAGDTVNLAGTERFVTDITLGVQAGSNLIGQTDDFRVSFYLPDGPDDGPQTLLWQSDFLTDVVYTGSVQPITFDVPLVEVPDALVWMLYHTNTMNGGAAFVWANPPTVGSSPSYAWTSGGKHYPAYGVPANFMARIEAVPEPATILLLGLGAVMLRRKRR